MSDGRTWGTVIGGVVGFFTGGIGWAAGAAIGGAVGGLLEPKKRTETNRIDDIKVSLSKYGDGIPETHGNNIPSATCVWSTYIIELPETQSAGKGGGVENTNYRQFIQSMWCLGKTPPPGSTVSIRKVWIDGKLNYDASSGLTLGQALATKENPWADIVLLPGFDDQLPVPMIETYEGVGNVPAFRGRICVFIFGLECPGGRVPQLQFEICINPGSQIVDRTITTFVPTWLATLACIDDPSAMTLLYGPGWDNDYDEFEVQVRRISPDGDQFIESSFVAQSNEVPARGHSDEPCFVNRDIGDTDEFHYYTSAGLARIYTFPVALVSSESAVFAKLGTRFLVGWRGFNTDGPFVWDEFLGAPRDMGLNILVADVALTDLHIYVMHTGKVWKHLIDDLSLVGEVCTVPNYALQESVMHVVSDDEIYVLDHVNSKVLEVRGTDLVERFNSHTTYSTRIGAVFHVYGNALIETDGTAGSGYSIDRVNTSMPGILPVATPINAIIESQNLRAGLSADQFDVSSIDDEVWGVTFKTPASARANISPLMTYAAIGVVEEDGLLRYFHRADKASIDTVPYEELGFAEDGSEPGDPFPLVRANAQEFPRSVSITYNDYNFDYQQSTVKAMRQAVDSVLDETQVLDLATDGGTAASIAQRILYERWLSQNTRSFKVSRKYAYWSAGDVVTFLKQDGTSYGAFMLSKLTDTGAAIEGECFPADGELPLFVVPGPGNYQAQEIQALAPPTRLVIADSAILRDQDSNPGVYAVMAGMFSGWRGAELFAGDEEASLQSRGTVSSEGAIGFCETVLGAYSLGNVDETNLITVNVGAASLSSVTRELLLAGSQNVALVGAHERWEVIKFQRADDLGDGRYILSGLLRGLQGTEWAAGLHQSGDTFLLMGTAGTLRPNFDAGSIGQTKAYKAVSLGRSYNSAPVQTQENTGEGLKPLSPTTLRKSFSTNDIVLTWARRTRLSQQWWLGNVPLGEESERYVIEIYSSSAFTTLKRTLTSTTPTVTYTSAEQVADFGSNQTTVHVRVYQVSGTVGVGHELQQSI
ncbi:MAG: hypothetical protein EOP24_26370 [Hyphomicrobiales bacterium]|nr:MAG: hypothetical protein EOP24_26370 [Hyphomicrobiales bacterium]